MCDNFTSCTDHRNLTGLAGGQGRSKYGPETALGFEAPQRPLNGSRTPETNTLFAKRNKSTKKLANGDFWSKTIVKGGEGDNML